MKSIAIYFVLLVVMAIICGSAAESLTDVCKDKDMNCATWNKVNSLCDSNEVKQVTFREKYCRETCQLCQPPKEECYFTSGEKSKHGCCWDGRTPAQGPNNKGCPVCENLNTGSYCRRFKRYCVDSKNTVSLRDECPETCGYCRKAASPCYDESGQEIICEDQCYDIAPEAFCEKRKISGFCSNENWQDFMKTNCAKTCYFCGDHPPSMPPPGQLEVTEPACSDKYGESLCELHMYRGRCTDKIWVTFMKKNCAKTCDFCDNGDNAEA